MYLPLIIRFLCGVFVPRHSKFAIGFRKGWTEPYWNLRRHSLTLNSDSNLDFNVWLWHQRYGWNEGIKIVYKIELSLIDASFSTLKNIYIFLKALKNI